jgi:hypothetical protein
MRFDHIVIHVDNDLQKLQSLQQSLNALGYPFDPAKGKHNKEYRVSNINIGEEYIEVVRLLKPGVRSWMPVWANAYDSGERGAFCIFLEVEDVERTAVAIKKAGVPARGPTVLNYPYFFGLLQNEAPYMIYYLPTFSGSSLQIALMQYRSQGARRSFQAGLRPNAEKNGVQGIRRVEVQLPNFEESIDIIRKLFPDLYQENSAWTSLLEKTRLAFSASPDAATHVRLCTVTSQRSNLGSEFKIDGVELITTGG